MQTLSFRTLAAILAVASSAAVPALAQTLSSGPTSTVVYASGNDLVIKTADGKMLNYMMPAGAKLGANGKDVALADLKPGTKLTRPVGGDATLVTGVQVVKGKVYGVTPPDGVTLSLAEGTKDLVVPAGTTFTVDGKKLTVAELKNNMMVEATIVTTDTTGASATTAPAMTGALLVAKTGGAAEDLPAAGTNLPLFGMLGAACLAMGAVLLGLRKPVRQA